MTAPETYLTIDDSPTGHTRDLAAFLSARDIPAIFFCRGDHLEARPDTALSLVQNGFTLANHTYSHQRASQHSYEWIVEDIARADRLIDLVYKRANIARPGKYFRFPHIDRGTGGWVVDYDAYPEAEQRELLSVFADGLNVPSMARPSKEEYEKRDRLQDYLVREGFTQPFEGITHPWYQTGEAATARDCLFTYSNCDWMVTERHRGQWPYKTLEDLKRRALDDPYLLKPGQRGVLLAHDQDGLFDAVTTLIDDLQKNGMRFLTI